MSGEGRQKGQVRLGEEDLGQKEALGVTLGSYSAKPREGQVVKWTGGVRNPVLVFEALWIVSLLSWRQIHHPLECENWKDS